MFAMMFRDQVGILTDWFKSWNECEQTVALLSLLKRVSRTQARFLHICLEHWLADCTEIHLLEAEANNAGMLFSMPQVSETGWPRETNWPYSLGGRCIASLFINTRKDN